MHLENTSENAEMYFQESKENYFLNYVPRL